MTVTGPKGPPKPKPPAVASSAVRTLVPSHPAAAPSKAPASDPGWAARAPRLVAAHAPAGKLDHSLAATDAQALRAAMEGGLTGLGTDEAAIFSVLANREPPHLAEVKRVYQERFGVTLESQLHGELSGADLRRAEALLEGDPVQAKVEQLHHATSGLFGAHSKEVLQTLEGLAPDEAREVDARFSAQFGRPLEAAVSRSLAGPARDEALGFLHGDRAGAWAARIDGALQVSRDTGAALDVLTRTEPGSLPALAAAYQRRTGRALDADVGAHLKGSERDLGLALLSGDAKGADVARLRHAVEGKFLGLGKDATAALAVLEGKTGEGRAALDAAYRQKYGASVEDDVVQRFGGREGARLRASMEGKLGDVERLQIAVKGWGADEKAVDRLLAGRSKESLAKLSSDFQQKTGEPLEAMLTRELSGRARFDALLALEGPPSTPEEAVEQARRRRDFERAGGRNAVSRLVMDRLSGSGQRLDRTVTEAETALAKAKADGQVDEREFDYLAELTGFASGETKNYRQTKDSAAEGAAVVGAMAVTVATAGAGAPLIVAAGAGGAAKVVTHAALSGQAYSTETAIRDGATGALEGLTGTIGGVAAGGATRLVGSAATTVAGRAAQGAVAGAVGGFIEGTARTALNDETWNSGAAEGMFASGKRGAAMAASGAVMGAGQVLAAEVNPWRFDPSRNNVVATEFPGEKKPVDLSKYRADKATRVAARKAMDPQDLVVRKISVEEAVRVHPELKKIPTDDLIGLRAYTEQAYREMNPALRGVTKDLKRLAPGVKTAASALNQLPPHTGTVYRGTNLDPSRLADYRPGRIITERAFVSTTTVKAIALGKGTYGQPFNGNAMFVIKSKGGGRAVDALSQFPYEKEILFGPGTEFKVLKNAFDAKLGKHLIYLQEVP